MKIIKSVSDEQSFGSDLIRNNVLRQNSKLPRPYISRYGNFEINFLPKLPNHYTNLHSTMKLAPPQLQRYFRHRGAVRPLKKPSVRRSSNSHFYSEPIPGSLLFPPTFLKFKSLPVQQLFQTVTTTLARPTKTPKIYPFYQHEAMNRQHVNQIDSDVKLVNTTTAKPPFQIIYSSAPSDVSNNFKIMEKSTDEAISSKLKIAGYDSGFKPIMTSSAVSIQNFVTPTEEPSAYRYTVMSKNGGHLSRSIPHYRSYQRKSSVLSTKAVEPKEKTNVYTLRTLMFNASSTTEMPSVKPNTTSELLKNPRFENSTVKFDKTAGYPEFQLNSKGANVKSLYSDNFRTVEVQPNYQWIVY